VKRCLLREVEAASYALLPARYTQLESVPVCIRRGMRRARTQVRDQRLGAYHCGAVS